MITEQYDMKEIKSILFFGLERYKWSKNEWYITMRNGSESSFYLYRHTELYII